MFTCKKLWEENDLDHLVKMHSFYSRLEETIQDEEKYRLEIIMPFPGRLSTYISGDSVLPTKAIQNRMISLTNGDLGKEYWENILQKAQQALEFYQKMEGSILKEEHWKLPYDNLATRNQQLPSQVLTQEIELLQQKVNSYANNQLSQT
tara:strand:- start:12741 stop:13187 length:447 start_codon:yes stop_codon:yes gene_type:complete